MRLPILLSAALVLGGCVTDSGPSCGGDAPVLGAWEYHGTQTTPAPGATIVGTLEVSEVNGCEFSGSLSLDITPAGGGDLYSVAGPIFGVAVSDSVVNFDAQLTGGAPRAHVAEVHGDSLAGDWIEGSGGSAPRGPFWARRIP